MSKLFDALNKVKEERQRQAGAMSASPAVSPVLLPVSSRDNKNNLWRIGYGIMAILLVVAVTGSVLVNFKTMAQLERSEIGSSMLAELIKEQNIEILAMRKAIETERKQTQRQMAALKKEFAQTKPALIIIEDLKTDNRLLREKMIALNDRINQMEYKKAAEGF